MKVLKSTIIQAATIQMEEWEERFRCACVGGIGFFDAGQPRAAGRCSGSRARSLLILCVRIFPTLWMCARPGSRSSDALN